jgi:hypothetical protein
MKGSHHHIKPPKRLDSLINRRFDVCFLSDIDLDNGDLGIGEPLGDQGGHLHRVFEVDVYKNNIRTLLRE